MARVKIAIEPDKLAEFGNISLDQDTQDARVMGMLQVTPAPPITMVHAPSEANYMSLNAREAARSAGSGSEFVVLGEIVNGDSELSILLPLGCNMHIRAEKETNSCCAPRCARNPAADSDSIPAQILKSKMAREQIYRPFLELHGRRINFGIGNNIRISVIGSAAAVDVRVVLPWILSKGTVGPITPRHFFPRAEPTLRSPPIRRDPRFGESTPRINRRTSGRGTRVMVLVVRGCLALSAVTNAVRERQTDGPKGEAGGSWISAYGETERRDAHRSGDVDILGIASRDREKHGVEALGRGGRSLQGIGVVSGIMSGSRVRTRAGDDLARRSPRAVKIRATIVRQERECFLQSARPFWDDPEDRDARRSGLAAGKAVQRCSWGRTKRASSVSMAKEEHTETLGFGVVSTRTIPERCRRLLSVACVAAGWGPRFIVRGDSASADSPALATSVRRVPSPPPGGIPMGSDMARSSPSSDESPDIHEKKMSAWSRSRSQPQTCGRRGYTCSWIRNAHAGDRMSATKPQKGCAWDSKVTSETYRAMSSRTLLISICPATTIRESSREVVKEGIRWQAEALQNVAEPGVF
ncbi:hypothetical protein B0H17DRAFT_1149750 [Mycena rosella]|uniref:Uncharacterized protein n=1 Tax=Mycena rosella TaxID=1033263 RepID=A0AAD7BY76_MYCRO|nr:hypothetical protein B0H17DRAFT_1149750 [Mycena rosella]